MNNNDLFNFILSCVIDVDQNGYAKFEAIAEKETDVKKFIADNKLENIKMSEFMELAEEYRSSIQYRDKLRAKKIKIFMSKSPEDIAKLPLEEKVEILETIFGYGLTDNELKDVCSKNKEKLTSLLYSIELPKEFWKQEEKQADRFVALVANNKKITDNMKNWNNLSIDDKKTTIMETAKIINYVYNTSLDIGFFTPEEFRRNNNLNKHSHVPGAIHRGGKLFFNIERLENSNNYMGVSVVFHEFMHKRQHQENFSPLIRRLFDCQTYHAERYEMKTIDKNSKEFGDIYSLMQKEIHAFTMQKYVEDNITNKTGIEKTKVAETKDVKQVHNKSFAMADISKARYNEK